MKTLKLRIKGNINWLEKLAKEVNFVWNYVNELSFKYVKEKGNFLSAYDVGSYLIGASQELNLRSHTLHEIAAVYVARRIANRKRKLKWRTKKSLGWVPFKSGNSLRLREGQLFYGKFKFKVWDSYGLEKYKFRNGSFNEDSKGNWYLNITVDELESMSKSPQGQKEIGIDLGLKDFLTTSDGEKVESQRFYRQTEEKLAKAQRAKKKRLVTSLNQKVKNQRKDFLQKLSTNIVKDCKLIVVGNVNSAKLAQTMMAKSVLDAGWSMFRTMLEYKAIRRQVKFLEVNESKTSLTCSSCKSGTGPTGLVGLGIREWQCSSCNTVHDRDVNAAKNILALGYQRLAEGVSL